jgi:osmotically-inducible protein OsmY
LHNQAAEDETMTTKIRTRLLCLCVVTGVAACSSAHDKTDHPHAQTTTSGAETADARKLDAQDKTPREPHGNVPEHTRPGRLASDVPGAANPGASPVPLEDTQAAPDNTAVNERDRDNQTLTPGDQSNSERDLDITKRIRETVVDDDSLSFTAKNVKIITVDGHVTLRGPVKNEQERRAVEKAAVAVAGKAQVVNEIEVR